MKTEENITWEFCKAATEDMLARLLPLDDEIIETLNGQNGIYLVAYEGNELGFGLWKGQGPKVVFVGLSKVNSSRHFKSGSTGTSTMRRSLAALLQNRLQLVPIPRSSDPHDNDRYNNYALDEESEEKLTAWMKENFRLAFYEFEPSRSEALHRAMLEYNVPIFNFQNNPQNKYGAEIKVYRKKCATEAALNEKRLRA